MSFDFVFQNAVRLHEQGKLDEAEAVYRRLLEINPEHTDLLHLLGMIAMRKKSFDSAIELLYKAVRLSPGTDAYEFTLAQALQDAGRPKEALEHYRSVLARNDAYPETYHNMGIIYRFEGDTAEARRLFQKAVEMRPDFASAYVNLALIERDEGDRTKRWRCWTGRSRRIPLMRKPMPSARLPTGWPGVLNRRSNNMKRLCRCRTIRFI